MVIGVPAGGPEAPEQDGWARAVLGRQLVASAIGLRDSLPAAPGRSGSVVITDALQPRSAIVDLDNRRLVSMTENRSDGSVRTVEVTSAREEPTDRGTFTISNPGDRVDFSSDAGFSRPAGRATFPAARFDHVLSGFALADTFEAKASVMSTGSANPGDLTEQQLHTLLDQLTIA